MKEKKKTRQQQLRFFKNINYYSTKWKGYTTLPLGKTTGLVGRAEEPSRVFLRAGAAGASTDILLANLKQVRRGGRRVVAVLDLPLTWK